jgi:hypothetical protein
MKAFLLFPDRSFSMEDALPPNDGVLVDDLALTTLFETMAGKDQFILDVARRVILAGAGSVEAITYRQRVLQDCLDNPSVTREIYALVVETIDKERKNHWGFLGNYPASILSRAVEVMQMFADALRRLRGIGEIYGRRFSSEGFTRLFEMLQRELSDDYFGEIETHLRNLKFRGGVLVSARLGKGLTGADFVLRREPPDGSNWLGRLLAPKPPSYTYTLAPRDEAGARTMSELHAQGINLVANALAQSAEHVLSFFSLLRTELAFYVGCITLHERLGGRDLPACFPVPLPPGSRAFMCRGLYDACLALAKDGPIVGTDVSADGKSAIVITGPNQGGKSTFLRAIGVAYMMMQAGMFVAGTAFTARIANGLFTHFKREEDTTMRSGKFDEELARMSTIIDQLRADSLVLFNESFAATNEREGSEIAMQILDALLECRVGFCFVTHMYELAHRLELRARGDTLFLRAERTGDGTRTFRMIEGEPLPTSFGQDLYSRIFGPEPSTSLPAAPADRGRAAAGL